MNSSTSPLETATALSIGVALAAAAGVGLPAIGADARPATAAATKLPAAYGGGQNLCALQGDSWKSGGALFASTGMSCNRNMGLLAGRTETWKLDEGFDRYPHSTLNVGVYQLASSGAFDWSGYDCGANNTCTEYYVTEFEWSAAGPPGSNWATYPHFCIAAFNAIACEWTDLWRWNQGATVG